MEIKTAIGQGIRRERERLNLSQEKLAELSGLDRTYISSIERGNRNISLEAFYHISKALKLSMTELIQKVEDEL